MYCTRDTWHSKRYSRTLPTPTHGPLDQKGDKVMPPLNKRNHLIGYGYTDDLKQPMTRQQYALALTSLSNLIAIANATRDAELFRAANAQLHRLAEELHAADMIEIWIPESQSYTVAHKG